MDETRQYAERIAAATKEIERLVRKRAESARSLEARARQRRTPAEQLAFEIEVAAANSSSAELERKIEQQRAVEREARTQLARKNKTLDEELERLEAESYRVRRPPIGQGLRLTEVDFRRAQYSVPLIAFLAALIAVAAIAVVSVSNLSLPSWLAIGLAILGLVIPTILSVWSIYYARRADVRAVRGESQRLIEEDGP